MGRVTVTCLTFLRIVPCENPDIFLYLNQKISVYNDKLLNSKNTSKAANSINSEIIAVKLVNINLLLKSYITHFLIPIISHVV